MEQIQLEVVTLATVNTSHYVVIMKEKSGFRRLPIIIGAIEAQSIAIELERISQSRPLTHDLFVTTLVAFGIDLSKVLINKVKNGVFYSDLICIQKSTETVIRIDARTSDAIALALRFNAPIFIYDEILLNNSFNVNELTKEKFVKTEISFLKQKILKNKKALQKAIDREDYELAAELKKRLSELKNKFDNIK